MGINCLYLCNGSRNDFCSFVSASLEIHYYVATGWDQYVDVTCQKPRVLSRSLECHFVWDLIFS